MDENRHTTALHLGSKNNIFEGTNPKIKTKIQKPKFALTFAYFSSINAKENSNNEVKKTHD